MSEIVYMPLEELLELKPYPTADIFPMLLDSADPPAGYEGMTMPQFADHILREGIREPLIIWGEFLLDGRNRREAVKQASAIKPEILAGLDFEPIDLTRIPVRYAEFKDEEEADSWVLSLNIDRRTMNKDQLACLAVKFWDIEAKRAEDRMKAGKADPHAKLREGERNFTADVLGRRFHVSGTYIQKARTLWMNDRSKFDKAASGRERVIGKLISPGQKIKPDTDPNELALQQINDAFNKIKSAMAVLGKANGDAYASAKNNVSAKIERLAEQFAEEFSH